MKKRILCLSLLIVMILCALSACSAPVQVSKLPARIGSMPLQYAEQFSVDYLEGGYSLISIPEDGSRYLLIPENAPVPQKIDPELHILKQPLDDIYLVASSAMDMFLSCDALSSIRYTAIDRAGWYIDGPGAAIEEGLIRFAGKYSAPDYELLCDGGCGLAVENTMIYHTPDVRDQLEMLNIPVLVDRSSYEKTPQGRMEWVKLYGLLTGHSEQAEQAFDRQLELIGVSNPPAEKCRIAFFFVNKNGAVVIRRGNDYISDMISLAGGIYVFSDYADSSDSASGTMTIQMEDFYASAWDADILIYNSAIDGELTEKTDLLQKSELFERFKAYENNRIYCTENNLYQSSMELGTFVSDLRSIISGQSADTNFIFLLR